MEVSTDNVELPLSLGADLNVTVNTDYENLDNLPSIEGVTLIGNKTASDLGLAKASDIPTIPVTSVNSKTGAVVLNASDVGALPSNTTYVSSVNGSTGDVTVTVPTKTSELQNDSGFLTSAPVSSVDGKTGAVTVLPSGGSSGQVLKKSSNSDYAVEWANESGGGTSDYTDLSNKPSINSVTLSGNKTSADLGIPEVFIAEYGVTTSAQIEAAYQAGKLCLCSYTNNGKTFLFYLTQRQSATVHDFGACYYSSSAQYIRSVYCDNDSWTGKGNNVAPLKDPAFTGTPTAPTASSGDDSTQIATTAFVQAALPSVPSAYTSNPAALGTASPGSSDKWARGDHVHAKPTYSKSDVGLGNVDNVQQYSANNPPPYPVTSVNGSTGAVSLSIPSTAADVGAEPATTEVTISTAGAVTQALDPGKIYHFTGALTALTITLTAPGTGIIPHYHFDFNCGSTAPTVTIPNTVTMPDGHSFAASKHYEVDILGTYGAVMAWTTS